MASTIEWEQIPDQQATTKQRQTLYKMLLRDREAAKELLRMATTEDAAILIEVLIRLSAKLHKQNQEMEDIDGPVA